MNKQKKSIIISFFVFVLLNMFSTGENKNKNDFSVINPPKWLIGSWHNSGESNTENFETFIFSSDNIRLIKGFGPGVKTIDFKDKFKGYKLYQFVNSYSFFIEFKKKNKIHTYIFFLFKVSYHSIPVLTYAEIKNGETVRYPSDSANIILTKKPGEKT